MTNRRILAGAGIAALLMLAGAVPAQAAEMPGELTGRAFSDLSTCGCARSTMVSTAP